MENQLKYVSTYVYSKLRIVSQRKRENYHNLYILLFVVEKKKNPRPYNGMVCKSIVSMCALHPKKHSFL